MKLCIDCKHSVGEREPLICVRLVDPVMGLPLQCAKLRTWSLQPAYIDGTEREGIATCNGNQCWEAKP